ncbi:BRO family protein [Embleya sp. NPDC008237]|uniref:BRO family protein n=1 Tax=Embleya sp. NPDC008237 TaxID=3363978 RepID=UPI0036F08098
MDGTKRVEIFTFANANEVRVVMFGDAPWFCALDVCTVLGHSNSRMAVANLDQAEKTLIRIDKTAGHEALVRNSYGHPGNPNMTFINESGLYALILRSNKPKAKVFRRWVTHEVLPSIRRTGRYTPAAPATSENVDALLSRAIDSITDLAARTGDLTKAIEINTMAVSRLTAGFDPLSTDAPLISTDTPPTSETHSPAQVLHSDFHRVIHRPVDQPTAGDRRRLTPEVVAACRRRARDGVSVYRLAREHDVSDSTMRSAVRGQTYRYVPEPPARP